MKKKVALITGVNGQDGAYLSEFLLNNNYIVHGVKRRNSLVNTERIDHLYQPPSIKNRTFILHYGDLSDSLSLSRLIYEIMPDEIYNLGAMSHVKVSFDIPEYSSNIDGLGTLRILEIIRFLRDKKNIKFYQASTSELFGKVQEVPQNEKTPFYPRSPYGVSKLYSFWIVKNYREAYNLFASNGILFNHESPIRGETFVTRKITLGISRIVHGLEKCLYLGNLNSKRDWGHAKDYVQGMYLILQHHKPDDFVLATGKNTSVRDFIKKSFKVLNIDIEFRGKGINEEGFVLKNNSSYNLENGSVVIKVNPAYFRPTEVDLLLGDSTKAFNELGWSHKYSINQLIEEMIKSDINRVKNEL